MKVIVKAPGLNPEVCEVSGIVEINKLVGNVDKKGDGYNYVYSDMRTNIGKSVDIYMNEYAAFNVELEGNIWSPSDSVLFCGTVVFAGYSQDNCKVDAGACSLTQEQIDFCLDYINKQEEVNGSNKKIKKM